MLRTRLALGTALLIACGNPTPPQPTTWPVRGTVVRVDSPTRVILDHERIDGFMDAMVMPFTLADPALSRGLAPGDTVQGTLTVGPDRTALTALSVTGHTAPPAAVDRVAAPEVRTTDAFPATEVPITGGERWTIGGTHGTPTLITFLYTTCPMPEFCPATVLRLQAIQARLPDDGSVRILAVTIDPTHDTLDVLDRFEEQVGARAATWRFGRLTGDALLALADRAGLEVYPGPARTIEHGTRYLVVGADGTLLQRYYSNDVDPERIARQLTTGRPRHDEERPPPGYGGKR